MSEKTVELVRRMYEVINAVGRTDVFVDPEELDPELWQRVDPEFELHERSDLPDRKVYRGREETKAFWRKTQELFAEIRWEPTEFLDLGHAIVVDTRIIALGRGSEVPVEAEETAVFWFEGNRIIRLQGFPTRSEAMAAATS